MSESSSRSPRKRSIMSRVMDIGFVVSTMVWALGSVFGVGVLLGGIIYYTFINQLGIQFADGDPMGQFAISLAVYLVGFGVMLIEPYAIRRMSWLQVRQLLGISRRPKISDLGYGVLAWAGYFVFSIALALVITYFLPVVNLQQQQDIGLGGVAGGWDLVYAFLIVVVLAPLVEELVFRGYLYGNLRTKMPWWLAAVITGALFGVVHGQWNVAIDVFVMSIFMSYLRERTGSIWAGMFVHALKNFIAFLVLFVLPESLRQLIEGS